MVEPIATHLASDGYRWHYRHYKPASESAPKARVMYLHGIQSHGGWYTHSCERLCQAGFEVFFLDRRGSGLNELNRGDAPSYQRLLDDVVEFRRSLPATPSLKTFLVGISWGGKLAAALPIYQPHLIDGVALLCPGFFARLTPRTRRLSRFLKLAGRIWPRKYFKIPLNNPELFTATPRWLDFFTHDPLALHRATARFLAASLKLDDYLKTIPGQFALPVLLMLGGRDRIIDNDATRRYVETFATSDRTVLKYPQAHHTLEFEPDPEPIIHNLIQWLTEQLGKNCETH